MNFNMNNLMKQAQAMKEQMEQAQKDLEETSFEGVSGSGLVTIIINGKYEIEQLKIDPKVIDPEDPEMLEDMVIAAYNDAVSTLKETQKEKMGGVPNGLNGLFQNEKLY